MKKPGTGINPLNINNIIGRTAKNLFQKIN